MPFRYPGPPDQDGGAKRWAELCNLDDSCPSNALARPTKIEAQKGGLSQINWRTCCWCFTGCPPKGMPKVVSFW
jgi:hypothetical protein